MNLKKTELELPAQEQRLSYKVNLALEVQRMKANISESLKRHSSSGGGGGGNLSSGGAATPLPYSSSGK